MKTEKELFDLIKESHPLNPRPEFVSDTSRRLRQAARKINRKRKIKYFSFASTSVAICTIALTWLIFFSGTDVIIKNFNTLSEGGLASSVNEQDSLIYIYQSHNVESFFTEAKTKDPSKAIHETNNITLVGERLSQSLKKRGINSIHDTTNVAEILKERSLPYSETYTVSREPLHEALEKHKSIKMVFDIHRDSSKRSDTTIHLNGKDYPRIALIVSRSSINYEENIKFAELLHDKLEGKYPLLSRGVQVKDNQPNQNTYNQDLLGNSVLLEIGGVDNTLQEEYRTADILAEIIYEILSKEK
ncbi:stage II sporulation protein P [Sutcliffiella halmapala]|uniref:stage II sporulation protein P n=1 Tax=Sutcliffiella halmapala TaxID=79882 RepID=UPI001474C98E|nr:stage II sporulation protein P [Sutcliffiella halmapala]